MAGNSAPKRENCCSLKSLPYFCRYEKARDDKTGFVRFGGGGVYQKCKPLFVGLIAGEILVIGITIAMDFEYYLATGSQSPVRIWFMPG